MRKRRADRCDPAGGRASTPSPASLAASPEALAFASGSEDRAREAARAALRAGKRPDDLVVLVVNTNVPRLARLSRELGFPSVRRIACATLSLSRAREVIEPELMAHFAAAPPPGTFFGLWFATDSEQILGTLPIAQQPAIDAKEDDAATRRARLLDELLQTLPRRPRFEAALIALDDMIALWDSWVAGVPEAAAVEIRSAPALARSTIASWAKGQRTEAELDEAAATVRAASHSVEAWVNVDDPHGADLATVSAMACVVASGLLAAAIDEETGAAPADGTSHVGDVILTAATAIDRADEIRAGGKTSLPATGYMYRWLTRAFAGGLDQTIH